MKKLFLFTTIFIATFLTLPIFNFYIDIARVFSKDYATHYKGQLSNELYLQGIFLRDHPEFTKIIFGSSRIGNGIDLQENISWYKAWHQGANIDEHKKTLQYLLVNQKKIDEIVIAIDHLSFFSRAKQNDFFRQPPSSTSFYDELQFYLFYLLRKPTDIDFNALIKNKLISNRKHIFTNVGVKIAKDSTYFINQNMFMPRRVLNDAIYQENISSLFEIKTLCDDNNIKFNFFIQSFHYKNLLAHAPSVIAKYKVDLLGVNNEYLDCSTYDEYKKESRYWLDISHYNTLLGNLLLKDVLFNKSDTCSRINKENILTHLAQEEERKSHGFFDVIQKDMKVVPHKSYFPNKVYAKQLDKRKTKEFHFNAAVPTNSKLLVLLDVKTFKKTKIVLKYGALGDYYSEAELFKYGGWPKVTNKHTISLLVDASILRKVGFSLVSDEDIVVEKISVFSKD